MEEFKLISLPGSTSKIDQPGSTQAEDSGGFKLVSLPRDSESQSGILGSISRTARAVPRRLLEGVFGGIPDIASTASGLVNYATGGKTGTYEGARKSFPALPPTSEELREASRQSPEGALTEPQGGFEEFIQDIASDVGSFIPSILMLGGGKLPFSKIASRVGKFAAGSTVGNALKGVAKHFGFGEGAQAAAKLGGQLGYNFAGYKNGLQALKKQKYEDVEKAVAGKVHDSKKYNKTIMDLSDAIKEGASKDKKQILSVLGPIAKATEGGKASVPKIISIIKDINGHLSDSNLLDRSKKVLGNALDASYNFIKDYDPDVYKTLTEANDIHKGFNQVSTVGAWLNKHSGLEKAAHNPLTKAVVWGNLLKGKSGAIVKGVATAGILQTARSLEEFRNLLSKSKDAWNTLGLITKAILEDNVPSFTKGIHRLDRIIDRYQEKKD